MKKKVEKRGDFDRPFAAGFLFAGLLLVMSVLSKFVFIFDGFVGIYLDLFQNLGYDLNLFGIIAGTIYAFVTGFLIVYLYNLIFSKIHSFGKK